MSQVAKLADSTIQRDRCFLKQAKAMRKKGNKLQINCPECGPSLKGATREMIGDTGVCPKCKAEFVIKQEE